MHTHQTQSHTQHTYMHTAHHTYIHIDHTYIHIHHTSYTHHTCIHTHTTIRTHIPYHTHPKHTYTHTPHTNTPHMHTRITHTYNIPHHTHTHQTQPHTQHTYIHTCHTYTHTQHMHTRTHTHTGLPGPTAACSGAVAPPHGGEPQAGSRPPPLPPLLVFLPPFSILLTCISTAASFIGPWFPSKTSRFWQLCRTKTWPEALTPRGGGQPWWCWPPWARL